MSLVKKRPSILVIDDQSMADTLGQFVKPKPDYSAIAARITFAGFVLGMCFGAVGICELLIASAHTLALHHLAK